MGGDGFEVQIPTGENIESIKQALHLTQALYDEAGANTRVCAFYEGEIPQDCGNQKEALMKANANQFNVALSKEALKHLSAQVEVDINRQDTITLQTRQNKLTAIGSSSRTPTIRAPLEKSGDSRIVTTKLLSPKGFEYCSLITKGFTQEQLEIKLKSLGLDNNTRNQRFKDAFYNNEFIMDALAHDTQEKGSRNLFLVTPTEKKQILSLCSEIKSNNENQSASCYFENSVHMVTTTRRNDSQNFQSEIFINSSGWFGAARESKLDANLNSIALLTLRISEALEKPFNEMKLFDLLEAKGLTSKDFDVDHKLIREMCNLLDEDPLTNERIFEAIHEMIQIEKPNISSEDLYKYFVSHPQTISFKEINSESFAENLSAKVQDFLGSQVLPPTMDKEAQIRLQRSNFQIKLLPNSPPPESSGPALRLQPPPPNRPPNGHDVYANTMGGMSTSDPSPPAATHFLIQKTSGSPMKLSPEKERQITQALMGQGAPQNWVSEYLARNPFKIQSILEAITINEPLTNYVKEIQQLSGGKGPPPSGAVLQGPTTPPSLGPVNGSQPTGGVLGPKAVQYIIESRGLTTAGRLVTAS
ncbi:MAG TPA: hypothetical protein V6C96_04225 [Vampirovibrionales bacterium]